MRQRVALLGLSAVGKSTLVAALHGKAGEAVVPTQGCNKSSVTRHGVILDLLDLGGAPQVRKFWTQLACDVHAFIVVVNAAEADDMAWALLSGELRRLRDTQPLLVLLNQRDVPAAACCAVEEALERLNVREAPAVHAVALSNSMDTSAAEAGLEWLCAVLTDQSEQDGMDDDAPSEQQQSWTTQPGSSAAGGASSSPPPSLHSAQSAGEHAPLGSVGDGQARAPTRLRVVQALRDARHYQGEEAELAAALSQKLASGHLLSEAEIGQLRLHQQRMAETERDNA